MSREAIFFVEDLSGESTNQNRVMFTTLEIPKMPRVMEIGDLQFF
jgi:hypothetical protein